MPEILGHTDQYKIVFHRFGTSPKIIITFDNISTGLRDSGFGTDLCQAMGIDTIYVSQKPKSQYQGLDLEAFERAVAPVIAGRDVYCYGASLGGYAALYYGGVINAKILASSPRNSAHPVIGAKEFKGLDYRHRELADVPRSSHAPAILYDPYVKQDRRFIEACVRPAYPEGRYQKYYYGSHNILDAMKLSGVVSGFAKSFFLHDRFEQVPLQQEGSYIYHAQYGRHLLRMGKPKRAAAELRKSLAAEVHPIAFETLLAFSLRHGLIEDILTILADCLPRVPVDKRGKLLTEALKARLGVVGVDYATLCETVKWRKEAVSKLDL